MFAASTAFELASNEAAGLNASRLLMISEDCAAFARRALAYSLHLRATNLATVLRARLHHSQPLPTVVLGELEEVLRRDRENQMSDPLLHSPAAEDAIGEEPWTSSQRWRVPKSPWSDEIGKAIETLQADPRRFLATYLLVPDRDSASHGQFSLTSR